MQFKPLDWTLVTTSLLRNTAYHTWLITSTQSPRQNVQSFNQSNLVAYIKPEMQNYLNTFNSNFGKFPFHKNKVPTNPSKSIKLKEKPSPPYNPSHQLLPKTFSNKRPGRTTLETHKAPERSNPSRRPNKVMFSQQPELSSKKASFNLLISILSATTTRDSASSSGTN